MVKSAPRIWKPAKPGFLITEASRLTGLAVGTSVVAGVDDTASAALPTGVITAWQAFISIGSGANIAANTDAPVSHPTILTYPHCVPGLYMTITVLSSTELSNKWMRNNLCQAETAVAAITGEDPYNDPIARACFVDIGTVNTMGDLLRATLEGMAFSIWTTSN